MTEINEDDGLLEETTETLILLLRGPVALPPSSVIINDVHGLPTTILSDVILQPERDAAIKINFSDFVDRLEITGNNIKNVLLTNNANAQVRS